jgi:predicted amidohydrolase
MSPPRLDIAVAAPELDARTAAGRAGGAGLLVLPRQPALPAEDSDATLAHAMGEIAMAAGLPLLFGYAEACSGLRHVALQLVLADGRATANYRATHLGPGAMAGGWSPGNWLTMARLEPWTLGLLGGADHLAPEPARALSALGAMALLALLDPEPAIPPELVTPLARLRAIENGVPVCLVGPGREVHAADALGQPIATTAGGGITRLTLDPAAATTAAPRRPELYHQLVVIPEAPKKR